MLQHIEAELAKQTVMLQEVRHATANRGAT